jgi:hypothetical protein
MRLHIGLSDEAQYLTCSCLNVTSLCSEFAGLNAPPMPIANKTPLHPKERLCSVSSMTNEDLEYRKHIVTQFLGKTDRNLEAYFRVYDELLSDADAHLLQVEQPGTTDFHVAPITHRDVSVAAEVVRENADKTLHQITLDVQTKLQVTNSAQRANIAIRVAVRAMFMLDSAVSDWHGPGFTVGRYRHVSWQVTEPFHEFVSRCFRRSLQESESVMDALANKRSLKAWKLKTRLGITFKATDNIAQHLLLDADNGILYLFHHTSFLKAQLSRHQGHDSNNKEDVLAYLSRLVISVLNLVS